MNETLVWKQLESLELDKEGDKLCGNPCGQRDKVSRGLETNLHCGKPCGIQIENLGLCTRCSSNKIIDHICTDCGLIQKHETIYKQNYNDIWIESKSKLCGKHGSGGKNGGGGKMGNKNNLYSNSRLQTLIHWNQITSLDRKEMKIKESIEELRYKIGLTDEIYNTYFDQVKNLYLKLGLIKRGNIKDAILLVLLEYSIDNILGKNANIFAKQIQLETKHITNARKIVYEKLQENKIICPINNKLNVDVFTWIQNIVVSKNLILGDQQEIKDLINKYKTEHLLDHHTPKTVAIGLVYYVLTKKQKVDKKSFCDIFNISIVTISKIYKEIINIEK